MTQINCVLSFQTSDSFFYIIKNVASSPRTCLAPSPSQCACQGQQKGKAINADRRAQALNKIVKPPTRDRASNAPHTRAQGNFSDPPVRLQHPRLRAKEPRFGFHEGRFHCGAVVASSIVLSMQSDVWLRILQYLSCPRTWMCSEAPKSLKQI